MTWRRRADTKPIAQIMSALFYSTWATHETVVLHCGELRRPVTFNVMLAVDESDFTPDHIELLEEWAGNLGISIEVLLARIVLATSEGEKYVESVPAWRPTPRE